MKIIHNNAEEAWILLLLLQREMTALPTEAHPEYRAALEEIRRRVAKRGRIPCGEKCGLDKRGNVRHHIHTSDAFKSMIENWSTKKENR